MKQVKKQADDLSLTLESRITKDVRIFGGRERLRQLTLNLLLNAIDASSAGQRITLILEPESGDTTRLIVRDEGGGIDSGDMECIFDPFFTTKESGTGMGLAVAKSIVESHEGEIAVSSKLGQGTEFTVIFDCRGGEYENSAGRR